MSSCCCGDIDGWSLELLGKLGKGKKWVKKFSTKVCLRTKGQLGDKPGGFSSTLPLPAHPPSQEDIPGLC